MESKVNYTLVGAFVLFMLAAIIAVILWLTVGAEAKFYDTYLVYTTESVSGLNPKASVKYRGVEVGRVGRVGLAKDNPEQVEIYLEIEQGTPIKDDTRALLVTQGLTGLVYLELTGGSRDAQVLETLENQDYPVIESNPSLVTRMDDAFTGLVVNFENIAVKVEELLNAENQKAIVGILSNTEALLGDSNREALNGALRNIETLLGDETRERVLGSLDGLESVLSEKNRSSLERTLANLDALSTELAEQSGNIGATLSNANAALSDIRAASDLLPPVMNKAQDGLTALEGMATAIAGTAGNLDVVLAEGRHDLELLAQETVPGLNALLEELRILTASLQRVSDELERNPQSLVFGKAEPALGPGESNRNNR